MTKEQFITIGLSEEQATKAAEESAKELKEYVPMHRFEEVNIENKNLKKTATENEKALEDLKKAGGNSEELKNQIQKLQDDVKETERKLQEELKETKMVNAIKLSIVGKAHDEELVAGLFDKTKLILSEDGKVTGLDEQLKTLQESKGFLFKPADEEKGEKKTPYEPRGGTDNVKSYAKMAAESMNQENNENPYAKAWS